MHRVEKAGVRLVLLLGCALVGCDDQPREREDDAGSAPDAARADASEGGGDNDAAGPDVDARADADADMRVEAGPSADAGGGDGGNDGSATAADAGPSQFGAAPFARPQLPVQRLAMARELGDAPVCVLLEDQHVYCADGYNDTSGHKDVSSTVPDNTEYAWLAANSWQDNLFYGGRSDGSVRQWRYQTAIRSLNSGRYLGAFGDHFGMCGLREDGQLACDLASVQAFYPPGTYVQFYAGVQTVDLYVGLRVDGALVFGSIAEPAEEPNVIDSDVFVALSARGGGTFCALSKMGTLSCMQNALNKSRAFKAQPYQNVRDFSEGGGHVCVVLADGRAACSMLDGSASSSAVPTDKRFVDIETLSKSYTCGVTEAGELWCWQASGSAYAISLPKKAATR